MKTSKRNRLLGLALVGGFSLLGANNAFAAAGDTITNTATLSYQVGGVNQTDETATTDFIEDRLINFTVVNSGATTVVSPNATSQAVSFTLTNTGNAPQGFLLLGLNNGDGATDPHGGSADIFEATSVQTFVETNGTAGYQPGGDTAVSVERVDPGNSVVVYVVGNIPSLRSDGTTPLANNDVAVMDMVVQVAEIGALNSNVAGAPINADDNGNNSPGGTGFSNGTVNVTAGAGTSIGDDPANMETVFNDPAGTRDALGNADAAQNGQNSANSSFTAQAAALTVTKLSAALWDPVNANTDPKSIPGGYVRYIISIVNAAGAADAALTTLSDPLPATLLLDPDYIDGSSTTPGSPGAPTSAPGDAIVVTKGGTTVYCTGDVSDADGDGCTYTGGAGGTVSVDLSNAGFAALMPLAGGETVTIGFNVIVQ